MSASPSFTIDAPEVPAESTSLVVATPHLGMASVTAADYVVSQTESTRVGHVRADGMPSIAPFEAGEPRHHTRLYHVADSGVVVLLSDLFVPVWAADQFGAALSGWLADAGLDEVAILHGVPYPHAEEEHAVYSVASEGFPAERLAAAGIEPLGGGYLDGVPGALVTDAMEGRSPPAGVFVTPVHPPGPDIDAAIRLVTALREILDLPVDLEELERRGAELHAQYAELADRMQAMREEGLASRDYPEDRMYM